MRTWGVYLPHLEQAQGRLRDAAETLEQVLALNPNADIDMAGELGKTARELRALVNLISEAARAHEKAPPRR